MYYTIMDDKDNVLFKTGHLNDAIIFFRNSKDSLRILERSTKNQINPVEYLKKDSTNNHNFYNFYDKVIRFMKNVERMPYVLNLFCLKKTKICMSDINEYGAIFSLKTDVRQIERLELQSIFSYIDTIFSPIDFILGIFIKNNRYNKHLEIQFTVKNNKI